jgi:hypothetical protein
MGDRVRLRDGWGTIEGVADSGEVATVYNCRISDNHTYFVGAKEWSFSVWAHNAYTNTNPAEAEAALAEDLGGELAQEVVQAGAAENVNGDQLLGEVEVAIQAGQEQGLTQEELQAVIRNELPDLLADHATNPSTPVTALPGMTEEQTIEHLRNRTRELNEVLQQAYLRGEIQVPAYRLTVATGLNVENPENPSIGVAVVGNLPEAIAALEPHLQAGEELVTSTSEEQQHAEEVLLNSGDKYSIIAPSNNACGPDNHGCEEQMLEAGIIVANPTETLRP